MMRVRKGSRQTIEDNLYIDGELAYIRKLTEVYQIIYHPRKYRLSDAVIDFFCLMCVLHRDDKDLLSRNNISKIKARGYSESLYRRYVGILQEKKFIKRVGKYEFEILPPFVGIKEGDVTDLKIRLIRKSDGENVR